MSGPAGRSPQTRRAAAGVRPSSSRSRSRSRLAVVVPEVLPPSRRRGPNGRVLGLVAVLVLVVAVLVPPVGAWFEQRQELSELTERRDRAAAEITELEQRAEQLQQPAQVEADARARLQWVREGELLYVVEDPADAEAGAGDGDGADDSRPAGDG